MADRNGYIGRAPSDSSVVVASQVFSPTGITTDFTFASGYVPGYFDIYVNGAKQIEVSDYTATDGSTFSVLNGGATSGDVIEGVAYKAFNAATASVGIYSGGDPISTQANILNFVGTGNTFALRGSTVDISISGGSESTTRSVNRYIATADQTLFPSSGTVPYTIGYIDVFLNGTKLDSTEFTATNGTTITLVTGATADDVALADESAGLQHSSLHSALILSSSALMALRLHASIPRRRGATTS